jgi:hypothetical protein
MDSHGSQTTASYGPLRSRYAGSIDFYLSTIFSLLHCTALMFLQACTSKVSFSSRRYVAISSTRTRRLFLFAIESFLIS